MYLKPQVGTGAHPYSLVFAAVDSSDSDKVGADFVCTGTNDFAAMGALLAARAGTLTNSLLLPGNYHQQSYTNRFGTQGNDDTMTGYGAILHDHYGVRGNFYGTNATARGLTWQVESSVGAFSSGGFRMHDKYQFAIDLKITGSPNIANANWGVDGSDYLTVSGCYCYGVVNAYGAGGYSKIVGNSAEACCVGIQPFGDYAIITGNVLVGGSIYDPRPFNGDGIYVGFQSRGTVISNNRIKSHDNGITAYGDSDPDLGARKLIIAGNRISDLTSAGIYVEGRSTLVKGNRVSDSGQGGFLHSQIGVFGVANSLIDNFVIDNGLSQCDYGVEVGGTANYLSGNQLEGSYNIAAVHDTGTGTVYGVPSVI